MTVTTLNTVKPLEYRNHMIALTSEWRFVVTGPEFSKESYDNTFRSVDGAKETIDERIKRADKARAIKIALHVVDEKGVQRVITGINRHSGNVTGWKEAAENYAPDVYPDVLWIRSTLERIKLLQEELAAESNKIFKLRIRSSRGYTSQINAEGYNTMVQKLVDEYNEKNERARNTPPFKKE